MKDRQWMLPAAVLLAVQFAFCITVALTFGFYQPPPVAKYASTAVGLGLLTLGLRILWQLRHLPESPMSHLVEAEWIEERGFCYAMVFLWLQFVALTWGKAMLPIATSMWADVPLANLDAALFGEDAFRLFPASSKFLDVVYLTWLPTVGAAYAILYFSRRPNRETGLLAFFITVGVLGTVGQYLLPSGGPIFFQRLGLGDRFADLGWQWNSLQVSDRLWNAFQGNYISFATGISAFPSIHVATSTWIALSFRNPLAYIYAALIFVGSVALGWHYALDGIAGALGAIFCYGVARWIIAMPAPSFARFSLLLRRDMR